MKATGTDPEVIVIGGGIIGLSIAYQSALAGLRVAVVDAGIPGATYAAAGMLAPVTEATFGEEDLLRLTLAGASAFPDFIEGLSVDAGLGLQLRTTGTLVVALNGDQTRSARRLHEFQLELGLDSIWLDADGIRKLEPQIHPSAMGGVLAAGDYSVDPRSIHRALRTALERRSVNILQDRVVEIRGSDGSAEAVCSARSLRGRTLVLAGGCWSGDIKGAPAEVASSIRPVKGQILRLRPHRGVDPGLSHVLRSEDVYIVPRQDGELVVGATMEEQGFDTTVTAGAVFELLRAADEMYPVIRQMELSESTAGLRPASLDGAPLIGNTSVPSVVVATGHFRNGVLLAPLTAMAIARLLVDGTVIDEIKPFDPLRFS